MRWIRNYRMRRLIRKRAILVARIKAIGALYSDYKTLSVGNARDVVDLKTKLAAVEFDIEDLK